ncbi:serine/threonine-protein phosphatase 7 long form homolog [Arachis hypogaea]|uniref:serine/threonine-protein phosphatase 7 long form homolog n=1 Tax=Arachis hypogaea TaxID=3818 RepID=UPI000DECE0D1|nr:serine/threonine-protein phosphatase 7 long form homolog [Arachis hypogaea]
MLAALVERWRPETHTFVLPIDEVTVTLENVAHIFGLPIDGEPVSGWTDSSSDFVQSQGIAIFGRQPSVSDNAKSYIKLGWVRRIRDAELLDTEESIRQYFRCQIFCLLGSTLFTDKSTAYAHAKYPPLLRDFERIHTYSWGSACLAHLYRTLCRASRYDTKEMDGPLNLLFVWAWERMPCLAPVPRQTLPPAEIPVARRWSHSERTTAWSSKTVETFMHDIDNKLLQSPPERYTAARIDSCWSEIIPTPSFLTTYIRRFLRKKCHASVVSPSTKAKAIGTMF